MPDRVIVDGEVSRTEPVGAESCLPYIAEPLLAGGARIVERNTLRRKCCECPAEMT